MSSSRPSRSLPSSPSLEHLKHQAKDLLKAFRADDQLAQQRVTAQLPRFARPSAASDGKRGFLLSDAQLVIAREYGFTSWPKLKAQIEALARGTQRVFSAAATRRAARAQATQELARSVAELARAHNVFGLASIFSRMPRHEILSVRAHVMASDDYAALVDALLAGLEHRNARVRYDCAHALDHFADDRCIEPLRRLLDDPVPRVRRMALHVLSCDACKLVPLHASEDLTALVIDHALHDPSINVRRHATTALGAYCDDERIVQALETLLAQESDPTVLRNARWALWRRFHLIRDDA